MGATLDAKALWESLVGGRAGAGDTVELVTLAGAPVPALLRQAAAEAERDGRRVLDLSLDAAGELTLVLAVPATPAPLSRPPAAG